MGLDMRFYSSKKRVSTNKFNNMLADENISQDVEQCHKVWKTWESETEEIYYFRGFYELHNLISDLYQEDDPEGFEKFGNNGTFVELSVQMLEKIEDWCYNSCDDKAFYDIVCGMIFRAKHGEFFYYEGDD